MAGRDWDGIVFRLKQEATNAARRILPPRAPETEMAPLPLPDGAEVAAKLRGTWYAERAIELGEAILAHRFPLLGTVVETGAEIDWRRDYVNGAGTPARYFRRIPYLDFERVGDHKVVWELSRHQHLVALAQAWLLSGREEFLAEIWTELGGWMNQNPYPLGIHWASALEVGMRGLSWLWVDHLAGEEMPEGLRERFEAALFAHGAHLRENLSIYFSPNTHLLGEAVALHALGLTFAREARAADWAQVGAAIVSEEARKQVRADGAHFEQSTYYHVYALDMLLFHAVLKSEAGPAGGEYPDVLVKMGDFLHTVLGIGGEIAFLGDDDGGRFFHPYGRHAAYGRASVAACATFLRRRGWRYDSDDLHEIASWWMGRAVGGDGGVWESTLFGETGLGVMADGATQLIMDAGPFGPFTGGHSHADTLSLTLRRGGEWILIDPGTYTYVADAKLRRLFRGTAMHNTVRVNGKDQAETAGPFGWKGRPETKVRRWASGEGRDGMEGECRYDGLTHVRRVEWQKPGRIVVTDEIGGPVGEHVVEQFWHAGADVVKKDARAFAIGERAVIRLSGEGVAERGGEYGWRSPALGRKEEAWVIRMERRTGLPVKLVTEIELR